MKLLTFEKKLWEQGIEYVAGVDEAGRGPLAGPLVVAAVIFNPESFAENFKIKSNFYHIKDSKQLGVKKRQELYDFIIGESITYSIVEIDDTKIDGIGLAGATQLGFKKAVDNLKIKPQHILTDYFAIKSVEHSRQTNIIRGDQLSTSIAGASILAKVYRDRVMLKMHDLYPQYGFNTHKGYGTKLHREALEKYGPCAIHRKSFRLL